MWPDIRWHITPEPGPNSVMAAALLCMLTVCMKLRNLHINCSVLMSFDLCVVVVANCNA